MNRLDAAILLGAAAMPVVAEFRGLRQTDRVPEDRATYSAGGRRAFRLDTIPGRAAFVLAVGWAVQWFVPHMLNGASESLARAAAAALEAIDNTRPTLDPEEL